MTSPLKSFTEEAIGHREMTAAFHAAGFEAWDVKMQDLLDGKVSLSRFRGIAFVGGFRYGLVSSVLPRTLIFTGCQLCRRDGFRERLGRTDTFQQQATRGMFPASRTAPDWANSHFFDRNSERSIEGRTPFPLVYATVAS